MRKNVTAKPGLHVGPGSVLWAPAELKVGADVYIGKNVTIEVDGEIGDGVLIANTVGIVGRTDHDLHDRGATIRRSRWVGEHPKALSMKTVVGSDVWIGYGAIVLSGVVIGDSAIIAAGSVVISDVPSNSVVAGNPARTVRQRFSEQDLRLHWDQLETAGVRILVGRRDGIK